jgi:hypothetical protein
MRDDWRVSRMYAGARRGARLARPVSAASHLLQSFCSSENIQKMIFSHPLSIYLIRRVHLSLRPSEERASSDLLTGNTQEVYSPSSDDECLRWYVLCNLMTIP